MLGTVGAQAEKLRNVSAVLVRAQPACLRSRGSSETLSQPSLTLAGIYVWFRSVDLVLIQNPDIRTVVRFMSPHDPREENM